MLSIKELMVKAIGLGMSYIIVTDHYEQIASLEKPPAKAGWLTGRPVCSGWENYIADCEAAHTSDFRTYAGTEITTKWNAEPDTVDESHTLGLGLSKKSSDSVIDDTCDRKFDAQAALIKQMNVLGWLPTEAHPTLISTSKFALTPWSWERLRCDRRSEDAYLGICGTELFNCLTEKQGQEALEWYLSMNAKHQSVYVESGCDSHGWAAKLTGDDERWKRVTLVMPTISDQPVIDGLKAGRSIATALGAKLIDASLFPGFNPRKTNAPVKFAFVYDLKGASKAECCLYRDGELIKTETDLNRFYYCDEDVAAGVHWYVFVIKGMIVTSPIVLDVKR
jgi:hypothetical protein